MMGNKGCADGDEVDAFTGWRKLTRWPRGELKRIKRKFHKRQRKAARLKIGRAGMSE